MGASVRSETGAFHKAALDMQFEAHLGPIAASPGLAVTEAGWQRAAFGVFRGTWCLPKMRHEHRRQTGSLGGGAVTVRFLGRRARNALPTRDLAQSRDLPADGPGGVVDLRFGAEAPETQPERTLRQ